MGSFPSCYDGVDAIDGSGGVVYEVNVKFPHTQAQEFKTWISNHTKTDLEGSPGFKKAEYYCRKVPDKPTIIFVLGGPGSGKGTQCAKIAEQYGYAHISSGDCLRAEQESGSEDATFINKCIAEGKLVPGDLMVNLLHKAIKNCGKQKVLIDGFPRNLSNVEGWSRIISQSVNVSFVLYFDCPEDVLEARLLERGKTSGRADDNVESIKKRFKTFQDETKPIVEMYRSLEKVQHIISDGSVDEVWEKVKSVMDDAEKTTLPENFREYIIHYHLEDIGTLERIEREVWPTIEADMPPSIKEKSSVCTRYLNTLNEM